MPDNARYVERRIPMNVTDSGRCFNGLFRTRILIEGLCMAAPIGLILFFAVHPESYITKIQIIGFGAGAPLVLGIFGIPPYSLFEFVGMFMSFRKNRHYAKYNPRMKWETTPDFLVHPIEEPFLKQIMNALDTVFNRTHEEEEDIDSNILNPTHNEQFIDDEEYLRENDLIPDELKTPAQLRTEARARKAAEKEARKQAKIEEKEKKKKMREEAKVNAKQQG